MLRRDFSRCCFVSCSNSATDVRTIIARVQFACQRVRSTFSVSLWRGKRNIDIVLNVCLRAVLLCSEAQRRVPNVVRADEPEHEPGYARRRARVHGTRRPVLHSVLGAECVRVCACACACACVCACFVFCEFDSLLAARR